MDDSNAQIPIVPASVKMSHQLLRLFWSRNRIGYRPDQDIPQYRGLLSCWSWTGSLNAGGYGKTKVNGQTVLAHRLSWLIHFGPIPDGAEVLHKCDCRNCVNPEHLFLGDVQTNCADRVSKGRSNTARGTRLPQSRLTEHKVAQIRKLLHQGVVQTKIARDFNTTQKNISKIALYKSWKHVR